jgi:hypothetical protein
MVLVTTAVWQLSHCISGGVGHCGDHHHVVMMVVVVLCHSAGIGVHREPVITVSIME